MVLTAGKLGVRNCAVTHMLFSYEVQFFTDPLKGRHLAGWRDCLENSYCV